MFRKKSFLKPKKIASQNTRIELLKCIQKLGKKSMNGNEQMFIMDSSYQWRIFYGSTLEITNKDGTRHSTWQIASDKIIGFVKKIGNFQSATEKYIAKKYDRKAKIIAQCENELTQIPEMYKSSAFSWFMVNGELLFITNKCGKCVFACELVNKSNEDDSKLYPDV